MHRQGLGPTEPGVGEMSAVIFSRSSGNLRPTDRHVISSAGDGGRYLLWDEDVIRLHGRVPSRQAGNFSAQKSYAAVRRSSKEYLRLLHRTCQALAAPGLIVHQWGRAAVRFQDELCIWFASAAVNAVGQLTDGDSPHLDRLRLSKAGRGTDVDGWSSAARGDRGCPYMATRSVNTRCQLPV